jgi:release factor glutamine methyltransferase
LDAAGVEQPDLEARYLIEQASGVTRAEVALLLDQPATQRSVAHFDAMLGRRLAGETLKYVLGAWGFRELDLLVDRRALIPRPETEVVVQEALAELDRFAGRARRRRALDLGTGCGAIALSLVVERDDVEVWAVDASSEAVALARANLAGVGQPAARVQLFHGSWFDALPADAAHSFDVVVSNPPYIADDEVLPSSVADWEPEGALRAGPLGTEAFEVLLGEGREWLVPSGSIVLELAPSQAESLASRAAALGYVDVRVVPDLAQRERVLVARAPTP